MKQSKSDEAEKSSGAGSQLMAQYEAARDQLVNLGDDELLARANENIRRLSIGLMDTGGPIEKAFYAKDPEAINYADKPLALGAKIKKIPREAFAAQQGITWSNTPSMHQLRKQKLLALEEGSRRHENMLFFNLYFGTMDQNLCICQVDPRVGKGVFTTKALKQFDYIGIYTGFLESADTGYKFQEYGYPCASAVQNQCLFSQHYGTGFYNADQIRNYISYIQHAPNERDALAKLNLPKNIEDLVATSNVGVVPVVHLGYPLLIMFALRDIKANEQLFYDYGTYWDEQCKFGSGDGRFALFDMRGQVIGTTLSMGEFIQEPSYNLANAPKAKRHPYDFEEKFPSYDKTDSVYSKDFHRYFIQNVQHTIHNALSILPKEHHKNLRRLMDATQKGSPIKIHNRLVELFKTSDYVNNPVFKSFLHELYLYINIHAADGKKLNQLEQQPSLAKASEKEKPKAQNVLTVQDKSEEEILLFVKILHEKTGLSWKGKHQQVWAIGAEDKITNVKGCIEIMGIKALSCGKVQGKEDFCMTYDARHFNQKLLESIVCSTAVPSPSKNL